MSMRWPAERVSRLRELHAAGKTNEQIAHEMGLSYHQVQSKLKRVQVEDELATNRGATTGAQTAEIGAFRKSALESRVEELTRQLHKLKSDTEPRRLEVVGSFSPTFSPTSPHELWVAAESICDKAVEGAKASGQFKLSMDDGPIAVAFIGDQHIAPGAAVDMRRMREDAELVRDTDGLYCVLGGDACDNHIKHRSAVLSATSTPHEQWILFEYYLGIIAEKLIAMISGNHDSFTDQIAGIDMLALIAGRQRICYAPDEARIDLTLGGQLYQLAARHQGRFNSSFNLSHAVKQWWRLGERCFDIGCQFHYHESTIEPFMGHGMERWAARGGSYQLVTSYSRQYGHNMARPICPTFVIYPHERRIEGFHDVRRCLNFLKAERGGWVPSPTKMRQKGVAAA